MYKKQQLCCLFSYIPNNIYNNAQNDNDGGDDKYIYRLVNPVSANPTNWSNTLKQFIASLPTNCLSVFDHFVGLALKGLTSEMHLASFPPGTITKGSHHLKPQHDGSKIWVWENPKHWSSDEVVIYGVFWDN